jgi:uncharacterized protein YkwD
VCPQAATNAPLKGSSFRGDAFMRKSLSLFLMVVGFTSAALAQKGASSAERGLLEEVNHERKASGLCALHWDAALAAAARKHAQEMAKRQAVEHNFPGEPNLPSRATKAGARFISISENVVQATSAQAAHSQFMHSANHKANILDSDIDSVGIGVAERGGELFVVQDFSKAKK